MAEHDRAVAALDRDLRYFPIGHRDPKHLTPEQLAQFDRDGYLTGIDVLDAAETATLRQQFDALLAHFHAHGKDSFAIDRYQDRVAMIHDVARHPRLLDAVEDLLGPDLVCWATHFFCKLPGDERGVAWHQDCSYWALTPSKTVTVWLAIDDVDRANGAMQVLPGSHLGGLQPWRETDVSDRNILSQAIDDIDRFGRPVTVSLRAGQASLHSDLLVHGSHPNRSDRRRCGLTLRYCPPDVRAYWNWNASSIICRGADASGHWANVPRPPEGFDFPFRA